MANITANVGVSISGTGIIPLTYGATPAGGNLAQLSEVVPSSSSNVEYPISFPHSAGNGLQMLWMNLSGGTGTIYVNNASGSSPTATISTFPLLYFGSVGTPGVGSSDVTALYVTSSSGCTLNVAALST